MASQPSLKRVWRSASAATNTRQCRIIQANGEGVVQLPVEAIVAINVLIMGLCSVPTGRVVVLTGRYIVPAGKVIIIVSTGRLSLVPTGRVLSPGRVK
ncbi:hypothetical protein Tco_0745265 [Tanacetum coccineum]